MDAIYYYVCSEGRIIKCVVYIALGDMNRRKGVLGVHVGESDSDRFYLSIMSDHKSRGVEDILIVWTGLLVSYSYRDGIPVAGIQQCIIALTEKILPFLTLSNERNQK